MEPSASDDEDFSGLEERLLIELPPVSPPAAVREWLLASLRSFPQRSETKRRGEGRWNKLTGGARAKILRHDANLHLVTCLIEMRPDARLAGHTHHGAEQSFVLSGSCRLGNVRLSEGDFHAVEPGTEHAEITSEDGCLLLVVMDERDCFAMQASAL